NASRQQHEDRGDDPQGGRAGDRAGTGPQTGSAGGARAADRDVRLRAHVAPPPARARPATLSSSARHESQSLRVTSPPEKETSSKSAASAVNPAACWGRAV